MHIIKNKIQYYYTKILVDTRINNAINIKKNIPNIFIYDNK